MSWDDDDYHDCEEDGHVWDFNSDGLYYFCLYCNVSRRAVACRMTRKPAAAIVDIDVADREDAN